jgi:hypothetical protein
MGSCRARKSWFSSVASDSFIIGTLVLLPPVRPLPLFFLRPYGPYELPVRFKDSVFGGTLVLLPPVRPLPLFFLRPYGPYELPVRFKDSVFGGTLVLLPPVRPLPLFFLRPYGLYELPVRFKDSVFGGTLVLLPPVSCSRYFSCGPMGLTNFLFDPKTPSLELCSPRCLMHLTSHGREYGPAGLRVTAASCCSQVLPETSSLE